MSKKIQGDQKIIAGIKNRTLTVSGKVTGMKLEDAKRLFPETQIRPMKENGQDLMGIMDFRLDRVNVQVKDGIIVSVISLE